MTEHDSTKHDEQTMAWIQACLHLSRRKISALMRNDLVTLEQCLEDEEKLLSLRPSLQLGHLSKTALSELRALNTRNRALVQNGLEFSRIMLDTIRPPMTYSELVTGQATTDSGRSGTESILSVKC
jgi:hypothetical protein